MMDPAPPKGACPQARMWRVPLLLLLQTVAVAGAAGPPTQTIDIAATFGGINTTTIGSAIQAAKGIFAHTPDTVVVLFFQAGTWVIHESQPVMDVTRVKPGPNGRLVLAGAGMHATTLSTDGTAHNVITGTQTYRVTWRDMHFTRNTYRTTQGHVVSVAPGVVTLAVPSALPSPLDLFDTQASQGRFLRRYTDSDTDAHVVTDSTGGRGWPPATNVQIPWSNVTRVPFAAGGAGAGAAAARGPAWAATTAWALTLAGGYRKAVAGYKVGDLVCVKSKDDLWTGNSYFLHGGDDVAFERVRWTQHSRGVVRGGISNVRFEDTVVERPPPVAGITPCLATAGGGPQIGQPGDGPVYNVTVRNHTSTATGDDSIALFRVQTGSVTGCSVRDSFVHGIVLYTCAPGVRVSGNTVLRCPITRTHNLTAPEP